MGPDQGPTIEEILHVCLCTEELQAGDPGDQEYTPIRVPGTLSRPGTMAVAPRNAEANDSVSAGQLYLCGHCASRHWPALSAQGWTIWPAGEHSFAPQVGH